MQKTHWNFKCSNFCHWFLYFLQKSHWKCRWSFKNFFRNFPEFRQPTIPLVSMEKYNEMEMLLRSGNVLLHYSLLWKIFFPLFLALILYKAPAQSSDPALFKNTVCLTFYWESFVKGFSETLCSFEDWGLGTWFLMTGRKKFFRTHFYLSLIGTRVLNTVVTKDGRGEPIPKWEGDIQGK